MGEWLVLGVYYNYVCACVRVHMRTHSQSTMLSVQAVGRAYSDIHVPEHPDYLLVLNAHATA